MSAVAGTGHGVNQSCFALILPELDQRPLYNAYNFSVENYDLANRTVVSTVISTLLCPETPLPTDPIPSEKFQSADGKTTYPAGSLFARSHYAANWGGSQNTLGEDFTNWPKAKTGSYRGVMMTVKAVGPRGPTNCMRSQDVRDGFANTVLVGEKRDGQGWNVGGYAGSEFDVGPSPYLVTDDPLAPHGLLRLVPRGPDPLRLLRRLGAPAPLDHGQEDLVCGHHAGREGGRERGRDVRSETMGARASGGS